MQRRSRRPLASPSKRATPRRIKPTSRPVDDMRFGSTAAQPERGRPAWRARPANGEGGWPWHWHRSTSWLAWLGARHQSAVFDKRCANFLWPTWSPATDATCFRQLHGSASVRSDGRVRISRAGKHRSPMEGHIRARRKDLSGTNSRHVFRRHAICMRVCAVCHGSVLLSE